MKQLGFTIFAAAALVLPLCAQDVTLRADIPFEFVARNTTVPPGQYVIKLQAGPVVKFVGSDSYPFFANPAGPGSHEAKLVFHRYGNRYFLSQIWTTTTSRELPMSRVERELKDETVAAAPRIQTEIVLAMR